MFSALKQAVLYACFGPDLKQPCLLLTGTSTTRSGFCLQEVLQHPVLVHEVATGGDDDVLTSSPEPLQVNMQWAESSAK